MLEYLGSKILSSSVNDNDGKTIACINKKGGLSTTSTPYTLTAPIIAVSGYYNTITALTTDYNIHVIETVRKEVFQVDVSAAKGTIVKMIADHYQTLLLTSEGEVYKISLRRMTKVAIPAIVTDIAAGGYHFLYLTDGGEVYGDGSNITHQLHDHTYYFSEPIVMSIPFTAAAVACGRKYSLILDVEGTVWIRGENPLKRGRYKSWTAIEKDVKSMRIEKDFYYFTFNLS